MEEKKLMEFKHPKYYKELRKLRNNLDQAISGKNSTECKTRSPGPGLKQQASSSKLRYTPTGILLGVDLGPTPQASSSKQEVTSDKLQAKPEPSSGS